MKKIYQVNVVYFDNEGKSIKVDSPFTNGLAYSKKEDAKMVFNGLVNDYKGDFFLINVVYHNDNIASITTLLMKIVITINEVELK